MANLFNLLNTQQPIDLNSGLQLLATQKVNQLAQRTFPQQNISSLLSPDQQQAAQTLSNLLQSPQQIQTQQPEIEPELVTPAMKKERAAREKQKAGDKKAEIIRQKEIDKETLPYYRDNFKQYEASKKADLRLNRMQELVDKEGGLPISTFYNLFKNLEEHISPTTAAAAGGAIGAYLGGPFGAAIGGTLGGIIQPVASILRSVQRFTSPNTEEYEKLTTDFVRDAKNIFGNRISNQEMQTFLLMIPTLSNTDAGKRKIINNMKLFNKAISIKYKAMEDIIDENDGRRPANLELLVEKRAASKLAKLSQKFTTGVPPHLIAAI